MSKWSKILRSGSFWGGITSLSGAMMGPPVLAVLPTKWAGVMIVVGTLLSVASRSIPEIIVEIANE